VRESTRTGAEWIAGAGGGGGSIAGGEVRVEEVALVCLQPILVDLSRRVVSFEIGPFRIRRGW
jgi:hypothetical protein